MLGVRCTRIRVDLIPHAYETPFIRPVRERLRLKHYSIRTEQVCLDWMKRFILFHAKRHPDAMASPEVEAFLTHLAVERKVSASTRR